MGGFLLFLVQVADIGGVDLEADGRCAVFIKVLESDGDMVECEQV